MLSRVGDEFSYWQHRVSSVKHEERCFEGRSKRRDCTIWLGPPSEACED
jgi:hypothetical protein